MKKSLLLAIFCVAISSLSFGQFNIVDTTGKMVNDSTIVIYGNATELMHTSFNVINTGLDSVKVYARRDSISLPIGDTDNYFCWVLCYGNATTVSPYSEALARGGSAGDTSFPSFSGYYNPYGHLGAALIRYTFFAARNHADSSWVIVKYIATPSGIKNILALANSFSTYPNPATTLVSFNYTLANGVQSANLKIFNLLGECVQTLPLSSLQNKASINVQAMPSGIYVCEIAANGCQPVYQKLVVSH